MGTEALKESRKRGQRGGKREMERGREGERERKSGSFWKDSEGLCQPKTSQPRGVSPRGLLGADSVTQT